MSSRSSTLFSDRVSLICFTASAALLIFVLGIAVCRYQWFPYPYVELALEGFRHVRGRASDRLPWYYRRVTWKTTEGILNTDRAWEGLNLVTRVADDKKLAAEILDMDGRVLHRWPINWFDIWPDADHLPEAAVPKEAPGTHIHGAVVLEDGDLVFNFEHLGLVRLDRRGDVVWRLPYQTHHSIHRHTDGNLWVCGQRHHADRHPRFPNRVPPFQEYTIIEVTPDGRIIEEWFVAELLRENGYQGLLHLGGLDNHSTETRGDHLHLNDAEPFPDSMNEGTFRKGDVLVSLRNINTVFVFNRRSRKVTFVSTGRFVRQHDPDFLDGERFSVFDNNNIADEAHGHQSRIVILTAGGEAPEVVFEGRPDLPFYSNIMGKHQWLPNGNLLITDSMQGCAFEIDPQGDVVWEYVNYVDRNTIGLVEEVQRLSPRLRPLFAGTPDVGLGDPDGRGPDARAAQHP